MQLQAVAGGGGGGRGAHYATDLDVNALKNIDDVRAAFEQLCREEESVSEDLDRILSKQTGLHTRLKSVTALTPQLGDVKGEGQKLSGLISHTALLAERVSAKVRQLDLAKSRVAECQLRVHDLIDLRRCSEGVTTALQEEDYEQAAAHIHRFLSMDEGVLRLTSRDLEKDRGESQAKSSSLDISIATLHQAENKVRGIVNRKFDEAVHAEDLASIERFFKIFPLLNLHAAGLNKFTVYLRGKLALANRDNLRQALDTGPADKRSNVIFADTLTLLFEGIARIVEIHQPLVETYYGPGRMTTVLSLLQVECDQQAEKIFHEFKKRRGIQDKVARIQDIQLGKKEDNKLHARDLDAVLGEMTLLYTRVEMYFRFIRKRCFADIEVSESGNVEEVEKLISSSQLNRIAQDSLGDYILLEHFFMSENIKKAVELDSMEADQQTTSMLDDVFFIVKKCIKRAVSSNSVDGICAVINNACTLLEAEFCQVFQNQIKLGFPSTYLDQAYTVIQSSLQGKLGGTSDTERQKLLFLAYLNNAESGTEYLARLQQSIQADTGSLLALLNEKQAEKIRTCLSGLAAVSDRLKTVLEAGMSALRTAVVKPRLKPWIDGFVTVPHNINDEQFAEYEANDPFVQALILNLDGLLSTFKAGLTPANYERFVMLVAGEVTLQLEKAVMKSTFSRLGGLQFDKELRQLSSYLTSFTTWTIRDKFARLNQAAAILNIETVQEVGELCGSQSSWKLTASEVRQILLLRADIKPEEAKRVKL